MQRRRRSRGALAVTGGLSRLASRSLIVAALVVEAAGMLIGYTGGEGRLLAAVLICLATMALLATRTLPEYLTALTFFVACAVGHVAPSAVFLAGFTGPAVWLVISGAIIGAAMRHTGFARRLGAILVGQSGSSFPAFLARVALFGAGLLFVMPSAMGRVLLLIPMLEATIDQAGLPSGDRRVAGVMLAGIFGTFFPAMAVLPANVPNNVLAGLLETTGIGVPSFTTYLLLHFPILGIVKLALIIALLAVIYRGEPGISGKSGAARGSILSKPEKRLAVLLGITIVFWLTDSLHNISAAWVGLAAAVICAWPGTGLMPEQALRAVGMEPVFYVAGVVGVGAVIDHSGLGNRLAEMAGSLMGIASGHAVVTFAMLAMIAAVLGLLVTIVAVPAILTPMAPELARVTGLPAEAVAMSQVVGFSTVFFPYQAPPLAVAMQTTAQIGREMVRVCFILAILSVLLVWPLDLMWWHLLGWLPRG